MDQALRESLIEKYKLPKKATDEQVLAKITPITLRSGDRGRTRTFCIKPDRYEIRVGDRNRLAMVHPTTGQPLRSLYVQFKEYLWDAEAAQRANGWTDEERKRVELYMLNHPAFGRVDGERIMLVDANAPVEIAKCVWRRPTGDGMAEICENDALGEGDHPQHCLKHAQEIAVAEAANA